MWQAQRWVVMVVVVVVICTLEEAWGQRGHNILSAHSRAHLIPWGSQRYSLCWGQEGLLCSPVSIAVHQTLFKDKEDKTHWTNLRKTSIHLNVVIFFLFPEYYWEETIKGAWKTIGRYRLHNCQVLTKNWCIYSFIGSLTPATSSYCANINARHSAHCWGDNSEGLMSVFVEERKDGLQSTNNFVYSSTEVTCQVVTWPSRSVPDQPHLD